MRLENKGAFFVQKSDHSIWIVIYFKNNYLLKIHPEMPEQRNKIFSALFDKSGRDYIGHNIPLNVFKTSLTTKSDGIYDYKDTTANELYKIMDPMDKFYSKKWFEKQYIFIQGQLAKH
jgi:hypothetical protein